MGLPAARAVPLVSVLAATIRRLLYVSLLAVLIGLAAALAAAVAPRLFGYGTLVVSGGSMGDSIPNGSLVIARWIDGGDVAAGDVILVKEEAADYHARPKLHRVVSLEQDGDQVLVRTRGDANPAEDPSVYILPDRVLTPAYDVPYLGFLVAAVSTPLIWLAVITIPGVAMCLFALKSIWFAPEADAARPV